MDEQGQQALGLDVTPEEKTVLLTNDLSPEVAKEAVRRKASVVVSYRTMIIILSPHRPVFTCPLYMRVSDTPH